MGDRQLKPLINRLMHAIGKDGGPLSDAQLLERFVLVNNEPFSLREETYATCHASGRTSEKECHAPMR
jgi:hypothetical protein